jgi:protein SCO1
MKGLRAENTGGIVKRTRGWITAVPVLLAGLLLTGCLASPSEIPYFNTPDFTPLFLTRDEAAKKITHTITDFAFTDQNNSTVTQKDIEGKIHVSNFFFTKCGSICPKMTALLGKVQETYKNDSEVVLLSFSVMPGTDSVPRLNQYAQSHNIDGQRWRLLTGNQTAIYDLARKSYFAEEDIGYTRDSSDFLHTEHLILVDRDKRIRGIYNGTLELEINQLISDIARLKAEK